MADEIQNPNSITSYEAFATSLTPQQRQFVTLYTDTKIAELIHPLTQKAQELISLNLKLQSQVSTLQTRVDAYEDKFRDDTKYVLTRAKIVALMKELNIK